MTKEGLDKTATEIEALHRIPPMLSTHAMFLALKRAAQAKSAAAAAAGGAGDKAAVAATVPTGPHPSAQPVLQDAPLDSAVDPDGNPNSQRAAGHPAGSAVDLDPAGMDLDLDLPSGSQATLTSPVRAEAEERRLKAVAAMAAALGMPPCPYWGDGYCAEAGSSPEFESLLVINSQDRGNAARFINGTCGLGNLIPQTVFTRDARNTMFHYVGEYGRVCYWTKQRSCRFYLKITTRC